MSTAQDAAKHLGATTILLHFRKGDFFSCNLQEHFPRWNFSLATCKSIFQGGIFLLQLARAFSEVDFSSCNLQGHFPRWNFPLATCKSIFQGGIFLLQPARAFSEVEFSSCNLQGHFPRWNFTLATCKSFFDTKTPEEHIRALLCCYVPSDCKVTLARFQNS